MPTGRVIIVHLRRPRKRTDMRHDPFWEFGSLGITGCHADNLLHPTKAHELIGVRLAFAQGGKLGTRLVFLSPPISKVVVYRNRSEVLWSPSEMPFRYAQAPLFVNNHGDTDFPLLKRTLRGGKRSTWVGQFGGNFRTLKQPVDEAVAREIARVYERRREVAGPTAIARNYVEALPGKHEPVTYRERVESYQEYREQAGRVRPARRSC